MNPFGNNYGAVGTCVNMRRANAFNWVSLRKQAPIGFDVDFSDKTSKKSAHLN